MLSRGVVVNFDLGNGFRDLGPATGELAPRARRVAVLGWVREGKIFLRFLMPNPALGGNLGQKIN